MSEEIKKQIHLAIHHAVVDCWSNVKVGQTLQGNTFIKHKEQKFTLKNFDEIVSLLCCAFTNPDELPTIKGCATIYVKGVDADTSKSKHINFSIASRNYTHCFKDGKFEIEIRDICIDNLQ